VIKAKIFFPKNKHLKKKIQIYKGFIFFYLFILIFKKLFYRYKCSIKKLEEMEKEEEKDVIIFNFLNLLILSLGGSGESRRKGDVPALDNAPPLSFFF